MSRQSFRTVGGKVNLAKPSDIGVGSVKSSGMAQGVNLAKSATDEDVEVAERGECNYFSQGYPSGYRFFLVLGVMALFFIVWEGGRSFIQFLSAKSFDELETGTRVQVLSKGVPIPFTESALVELLVYSPSGVTTESIKVSSEVWRSVDVDSYYTVGDVGFVGEDVGTEMKYVLCSFSDDCADEFIVDGFVVREFTDDEYFKFKNGVDAFYKYGTHGIYLAVGTNDMIEYETARAFIGSVKVQGIDKGEYDTIVKLFGEEYGYTGFMSVLEEPEKYLDYSIEVAITD